MSPDELASALDVERYGANAWWHKQADPPAAPRPRAYATAQTPADTDDDLTIARRRRELAAAMDHSHDQAQEAR